MNAPSSSQIRASGENAGGNDLPYAPLPMPRQQLESGISFRETIQRWVRLPSVLTRREL